ncbi:MAG: ATP-binding protein [Boseongicola sp. SB0677_bin_26]|nr:ATP-binding protein [Boseongicola sp. SB0665_bin_10]MYG25059.1 ATP-binding protein [Boseongicola sp. SB0677_bin_26]
MSDIDLEGLNRFAKAGDRDAPPYFAGRQEVLEDIEHAAGECWRAWQDSRRTTPGATRVIQGAPDAGKSSLLMHLERSWSGPGGGAPAMLLLRDPTDFMNGKAFAERLVNMLRPGRGKEIRTEISKSWQLQGRVPGVGGQLGEESRTGIPDDPINAVLAHVPGETWTSPVVIAIDEFQAAVGDETSPHAMVLRKLHTQDYAAPVVTVLAGLSDTRSTVDRLGISRASIDAVSALGCMSEAETENLIEGWSAHFGLPDGHWQVTMLELARAGDFWPAHVRNALASFAEEVVRLEGD